MITHLLVGFTLTVHLGLILLFSSMDAFIAGFTLSRLQELDLLNSTTRVQWGSSTLIGAHYDLFYRVYYRQRGADHYKFWDLAVSLFCYYCSNHFSNNS